MPQILFLGGPIDGQMKDVDETISPITQTSIKVTLPNGLIVQYHVNFFSGNTLQFPLACFEGLQPDDIFKMLLHWYSIKPRVRPMAPPTAAGPEPPPTEPLPLEPLPPDSPKIITTGD
jgi:hypothetical protein